MPGRQVILVYHSVDGPHAAAVPGSFPIPLARFCHQVQAARRQGWVFGSLSRLREGTDANTLYVTGDDGTVDWVRNVLPWCEAEKIPTHTAIITGPWQNPPVYPVAHRLQILLWLPDQTLPEPALTAEQAEYVDRVYAYETEKRRRRLKGACNVVLDDGAARVLLGPLSDEETRLLTERFATPKEYLGWHFAEFGPHTVSHRAFDGDVAGYLHSEVLPCIAAMERAGLTPTRYLTLPMRPRYPATVEQLIPGMRSLGFEGVLDGGGEWDRDSFIVPRVDAKHVEECLGLPPYEQGTIHDPTCLARTQVSG